MLSRPLFVYSFKNSLSAILLHSYVLKTEYPEKKFKNPIFPHATYYLYEIRTRKIYISYQGSKKSDFLGCFQ